MRKLFVVPFEREMFSDGKMFILANSKKEAIHKALNKDYDTIDESIIKETGFSVLTGLIKEKK